jgi:F-type H+-transporting ATPase subunit b
MHSELSSLLWPAFNFVILVGGIIYLTKDNFVSFVATRHQQIKADLESARVQLEKAEKEFVQYQAKLQNLDREVRELYVQNKADMENSKLTLLAQARKMSDNIVADAKISSESMVHEFKNQMKADLTKQVLAKAEALIRTKLTGEDRERIRRDFSKQVEVRK